MLIFKCTLSNVLSSVDSYLETILLRIVTSEISRYKKMYQGLSVLLKRNEVSNFTTVSNKKSESELQRFTGSL